MSYGLREWAIVAVIAITLHTTPVGAENPFNEILNQNDQILNAINSLPLPAPPTDLNGVTQSWNKVLPPGQRFVVLAAFNGSAVLDQNTGLVWERAVLASTAPWSSARWNCLNNMTGDTKGWRLPSIVELASLIDPPPPVNPTLQPGHPFSLAPITYWSVTADPDNPSLAWSVNFTVGTVNLSPKSTGNGVWCVRGPMQESVY
jgi:hypothetical protein